MATKRGGSTSRKSKATPQSPTPESSSSWSKAWQIAKKPWVWFSGFVVALALVLTSLNSIARDARSLPGEVGKTADQFFAWFYAYDQWPGHWTSNPEGWVDAAQWKLSAEPFQLELELGQDGTLDGSVRTKGICDKVLIFEELMIEGEIKSASRAELTVWDIIGGYRREFASLEAKRDGFIMTITPVDDPAGLFPAQARLGRDTGNIMQVEPPLERELFCPGKMQALVEAMKEAAEREKAKAP